jgi:hypothetical protein
MTQRLIARGQIKKSEAAKFSDLQSVIYAIDHLVELTHDLKYWKHFGLFILCFFIIKAFYFFCRRSSEV